MCDTLVKVEAGRVLFAKNSDRDANEAQVLDWQPARQHAAGSALATTWITIPQVPHTHAVLLSRPFWTWGAEMGANEHGLVIGNEAVWTNKRVATEGLLGMDLVRLMLERAATPDEAVDVLRGLLAAHGQGGRAGLESAGFRYHNSFVVACPHGALVIETSDRDYAVRPIHGGYSVSNALTLPGFAEGRRGRVKTWANDAEARRSRTHAAAGRVQKPIDMMTVLRDHGAGATQPTYSWFNGTLGATCMHGGGLVANSVTTGAWVSELSPGAAPLHWVTGTSAPDLAVFKPVAVGQPVNTGPAPTDRADQQSLWWRHEALHRAVLTDYPRLAALIAAERDALQGQLLYADSREAFAIADAKLAEWTARVLAAQGEDRRPAWAKRFWTRRAEWAQVGKHGPALTAATAWKPG